MNKHKILFFATLLAISSHGATAYAQKINRVIWNQSGQIQPAQFEIGTAVDQLEAVGKIHFNNNVDSMTGVGLHVEGAENANKGGHIGVRAMTSLDNYAGQSGFAEGRLSNTSGYFAGAAFYGVTGSSRPDFMSNYGSTNTSSALGGSFAAGPDTTVPNTLSLDGVGTYYVGGMRGEVRGIINGSAGQGAVAGVIGIDNTDPSGTATSYAAWFAGDAIADNWLTHSSLSFKDNVETLEDPLAKLSAIRGVRFDWKESGRKDIGVVAEEVNEVLPEIVQKDAEGKPLAVDYARLNALLIECVKVQQQRVEHLEQELKNIKELVNQ